MFGTAALADATAVWADIVGTLILVLIAAGVCGVIALLVSPKFAVRKSRRFDEDERRRARARSQKESSSHVA